MTTEQQAGATVLAAIRDGGQVWSTAAELAAVLDRSEIEVGLNLQTLVQLGLVVPWGPAWTLTPLAAEGLGVELAERGISGRLVWKDRDRKPAPRRKPPGPPPPDLRNVIDSAAGPAEVAERSDRPARRGPFDPNDLPKPSHFLDHSGGPRDCRGRRLANSEYCLDCDRWGFDWLVAKHKHRRTDRPAKQVA